jgi:glycosyltransferase involved in cell wall biosynthesis
VRSLQVAESLAAAFGGTAAAVAQLANHLARQGAGASVITLETGGGGPAWPTDAAVAVRTCTPSAPARAGYSRAFDATAAALPRPDVVHVHGLWRALYGQAAAYAARLGVPLVISAHGMLYRPALAVRPRLKGLARWLFQDAAIARARCLHATVQEEVEEIRRFGFTGPVAVLPWGVDEPSGERHSPQSGAPRALLYFGRLHVRKGIDRLLHAWARVASRFPDWRLTIAGPDPDRLRPSLESLAAASGLASSVVWIDAPDAAARERLLGDASLVVLPSAYENFGMVVAEALVRGVPAIATHGAPWSDLVEQRCGWWIPVGDEALAEALADALARSPDDLRAMGARGRRFARDRFSWDRTARRMIELYAWAANAGPEPSFVQH